MKTRTTLSLLLILFCLTQGFSQTTKKSIRIGATIDHDWHVNGVNSSKHNEIGLSAGLFIVKNLEIGIDFKYGNHSTGLDLAKETRIRKYYGPKITYMVSLSENLFLPLQLGYGPTTLKSKEDTSYDYKGSTILLGLGLEYILQNKIGIRLTMDLEGGELKDVNSTDVDDLGITDLSFGINYYFSK